MKKTCLSLLLLFIAMTCFGQSELREYVKRISYEEPFISSVWGMKAVTLGGKTIINIDSERKLVPASNTKLITTGLALKTLGSDFRWGTVLAHNGQIEDGVLYGDLYIVGSGDPSLDEKVFPKWKTMLENASISCIEGNIIADSRYFTSDPSFGDWSAEDYESEDASGVTGVSFKHNYRETEEPFVDDGLNCSYHFLKYLKENGFQVSGNYTDSKIYAETLSDSDSLTMLGTSYSPKLSEIIYRTNQKSDNFYAEALFRTMGKMYGKSDSYEDCAELEMKLLQQFGLDTSTGVSLRDGSGLSRKTYISPDFFVKFLSKMAETEQFEVYLKSLPRPGEGTLSNMLRSYPESVKDRIYMKSGSMNGIRCYSGYIIPENGDTEDTIVFSLLTNNNTAPSGTVLRIIDRMIGLLAESD